MVPEFRKSFLARGQIVLGLCLIPLAAVLQAEEFNINVGDTVSDGVPASGAGRLAASQESDVYLFTATAGQLVFADPLDQDAAFQRNLRWQLLKPNGQAVFGSFFHNDQGRMLLPDAGVYRIRVYTDGTSPAWTGFYSFRLAAIPPDQTFPLTLGQQVSDGIPAPGAGRLEVGGAEDIYTFDATAGQLVFFEPLTQAAAFQRNLRWQLNRPNGAALFSSFFSNPQGRTLLPETGQYKLRVFTSATDATWLGQYTFRTDAIAQDQTFPYSIGTLVMEGVPAPGAGKLDDAGSVDNYTFTGAAGQVIFFESFSQDAAFAGNLRWELLRPNGPPVFSSFFSNPQGRTVLPESGEYRLRLFTDGNQAAWFGTYSFNTRSVGDQEIPITIGEIVSDGQPAPGAGLIETGGSEDIYTFVARAGQIVIFESVAQAAAFQNNLRWELVNPSGQQVFSSFFNNPQGRMVLPAQGTYKIRVFTDGNNSSWTGPYSFRTYAGVLAGPDNASTVPDRPVLIPFVKLLFNDRAENSYDELSVTVPTSATSEGGTVSHQTTGVLYTPKTGFAGADRFTYRLQGEFGGTNDTTVHVAVSPQADAYATFVNWVWRDDRTIEFCLMGLPNTAYELRSSLDLSAWLPMHTLSETTPDEMTFLVEPSIGPRQTYFQARPAVGAAP